MALLDLQALELAAGAPRGGRDDCCDDDCGYSGISLLLCG